VRGHRNRPSRSLTCTKICTRCAVHRSPETSGHLRRTRIARRRCPQMSVPHSTGGSVDRFTRTRLPLRPEETDNREQDGEDVGRSPSPSFKSRTGVGAAAPPAGSFLTCLRPPASGSNGWFGPVTHAYSPVRHPLGARHAGAGRGGTHRVKMGCSRVRRPIERGQPFHRLRVRLSGRDRFG
jgi:hypothetical protein